MILAESLLFPQILLNSQDKQDDEEISRIDFFFLSLISPRYPLHPVN